MTLMDDNTQADLDELEFSQGEDLADDLDFFFFEQDLGDGTKREAAYVYDDDADIEYASKAYRKASPDYSKLQGILPTFERDLERFELERDKLKDRFTHAWNQGDIVSYLALEAKWQELNGFIKGLNVLKNFLRHWEEYDWGEMDIGDYYPDEDVLKPIYRQAAQKKFDTLTSRALQILARHQSRDEDPS